MNNTADLIYKLLVDMTDHHSASIKRIMKWVYLVDWRLCLYANAKLNDLKWLHDWCGPSSYDVAQIARQRNDIFQVEDVESDDGCEKTIVQVRDKNHLVYLSQEVLAAIGHITRVARKLPWGDLSLLVSSTRPMMMSSIGDEVDLCAIANYCRTQDGLT